MPDPNYIEGSPVVVASGHFHVGDDTTENISKTAGTITIYDAAGNAVTIDLPALDASWSFTLPANDGDANQFLKTDGSGNTSWAAAGGLTHLHLAGSSGSEQLDDGNTITIAAGTGILSTPVTATDTVTINTAWSRTGTTLSPATANDVVNITSSSAAGPAILGLTTADQNVSYGVRGEQDHPDSSDGGGVYGVTDATGGMGVYGLHNHVTGQGYGVRGATGSNHNVAYGGYFDRTKIGAWGDFFQQSAHPASPASADGRVFLADASANAWEDHKLFLTDEGGNVHDLTCQTKMTWTGPMLAAQAVVNPGNGSTCSWREDQSGTARVTGVAPIMATPVITYDRANTQVDDCHGDWAWTAMRNDGAETCVQSDLLVCASFRKFGDGSDRAGNCRIIAKARIRLSDNAHFTSVKLGLCDGSGDNTCKVVSADVKAAVADNTWQEVTIAAAGTDVGGWTNNLRIFLDAQGVALASDMDRFDTFVDIDWMAVEIWVD